MRRRPSAPEAAKAIPAGSPVEFALLPMTDNAALSRRMVLSTAFDAIFGPVTARLAMVRVVLPAPFVTSPVKASPTVVDMLTTGWEEKFGGKLEFELDPAKIYEKSVDHIQKKRKALGIDTKKERVLFDMEARRELRV